MESDTNLKKLFKSYSCAPGAYDELFEGSGEIHQNIKPIVNLFNNIDRSQFRTQQRIANAAFKRGGITFTVYSDNRGTEKIFPFDLIPRIINNDSWLELDLGVKQRINALNAFLKDIYGQQKIITEKRIPREIVESSSGYCQKVRFLTPPGDIYIHVAGIDVIRDENGKFLVLEDNLKTPSGVSYVLENRFVMKRLFPDIFSAAKVRSVEAYPLELHNHLNELVPEHQAPGLTVVLTPGALNSAYFEHSFLARKMGCELVKGEDLFVQDDHVFLKTTRGPQQVNVIYRRLDDDFLDPEMFRRDSMLGVPGLMRAYAAGNVVLANAVGNGIADDKAIYPYVPEMIRFYLDEEPILEQVATFSCSIEKECKHVLANLDKMVTKSVNECGGYGVVIGPKASKRELDKLKNRIIDKPRDFIAQPVVELSTCPTNVGNKIAARRVDLRPFVITGKTQWTLPGGLTRVALVEGSYVVNSSQGGGSKDTWVLEE